MFQGANDPHTPVAQGWLRASHRKLDPKLHPALPARITRTTSAAAEARRGRRARRRDLADLHRRAAGYRIGLSVRGKDYENDLEPTPSPWGGEAMKGAGPFQHNDASDRPPAVFGGRTTLHSDAERRPYVLLPVIATGMRCARPSAEASRTPSPS